MVMEILIGIIKLIAIVAIVAILHNMKEKADAEAEAKRKIRDMKSSRSRI